MADEPVAMKQELEGLRATSPKAPSPAQPVQLAAALPPPSSAPPGLSFVGPDPSATQPAPAGLMPAAGAPPGVPATPIWDDAGRRRTSEQAEQVLKGFTFYEASKTLDPHWAARFWAWLDTNLSATLTPELFALLAGHGYVGYATLSPPKASFRDDLTAFRDRRSDGKYYPPPQISPLRAATKRVSMPPPREEAPVQRVVAVAAAAELPAAPRVTTKRIQADIAPAQASGCASSPRLLEGAFLPQRAQVVLGGGARPPLRPILRGLGRSSTRPGQGCQRRSNAG